MMYSEVFSNTKSKSIKRRKRESLKVPFLFNNSKKISYAAKFIVKECFLDKSLSTFQDKVSLENSNFPITLLLTLSLYLWGGRRGVRILT